MIKFYFNFRKIYLFTVLYKYQIFSGILIKKDKESNKRAGILPQSSLVRDNFHNMKVFLGLLVLALATYASAKPTKLTGVQSTKLTGEQCDGTECPAGCCPEYNWFCCPDNMYCAATAADCPALASKSLIKMAAKKQCDGTMCPAGCCPEYNWFCCPDNMYCAATAADCPTLDAKKVLLKIAYKNLL